MKRMGRTHRPFFRINAVDKRAPRDGKVLEQLGWFDPLQKDPLKAVNLNAERIKHWLAHGAQPSDSVNDILARHGLIDAEKWKAVRARRVANKLKIQERAQAKAAAGAKGEKKKEEGAAQS